MKSPDKPDVTSTNVTVPYVMIDEVAYQEACQRGWSGQIATTVGSRGIMETTPRIGLERSLPQA